MTWFTINNNTWSYNLSLKSNPYQDTWTDNLNWVNDQLKTVEWQVLWFTWSTSLALTTDSLWSVTDSRISWVKFSTAKVFKTSRTDCINTEPSQWWDCLLSQPIDYSELGRVWTYLVRVRHIDQYWVISPDFSTIRWFEIKTLPISSWQYAWNLRSVANLSINVIAADQANIKFDWSIQNPNMFMTWITDPSCWTVLDQYKIYDSCIYNSTNWLVYWYAMWTSGLWSPVLKFEPVRLSPSPTNNYDFKVIVSRNSKVQTANISVFVTK